MRLEKWTRVISSRSASVTGRSWSVELSLFVDDVGFEKAVEGSALLGMGSSAGSGGLMMGARLPSLSLIISWTDSCIVI